LRPSIDSASTSKENTRRCNYSKTFRDRSRDQALLLLRSDFVPARHLSRFVVALVTEELEQKG
jgi:hypothetical protein